MAMATPVVETENLLAPTALPVDTAILLEAIPGIQARLQDINTLKAQAYEESFRKFVEWLHTSTSSETPNVLLQDLQDRPFQTEDQICNFLFFGPLYHQLSYLLPSDHPLMQKFLAHTRNTTAAYPFAAALEHVLYRSIFQALYHHILAQLHLVPDPPFLNLCAFISPVWTTLEDVVQLFRLALFETLTTATCFEEMKLAFQFYYRPSSFPRVFLEEHHFSLRAQIQTLMLKFLDQCQDSDAVYDLFQRYQAMKWQHPDLASLLHDRRRASSFSSYQDHFFDPEHNIEQHTTTSETDSLVVKALKDKLRLLEAAEKKQGKTPAPHLLLRDFQRKKWYCSRTFIACSLLSLAAGAATGGLGAIPGASVMLLGGGGLASLLTSSFSLSAALCTLNTLVHSLLHSLKNRAHFLMACVLATTHKAPETQPHASPDGSSTSTGTASTPFSAHSTPEETATASNAGISPPPSETKPWGKRRVKRPLFSPDTLPSPAS